MIDQDDVDLIKANVDFKRLKGARILITGGSGFVGHWLSVVPDYVTVRALNHLQYEYSKWHMQDWDYIIHLANVYPARVIECAQRCGATVLYSSSGSIFTDQNPGDYTLGKLAGENALLDSGLNVKIARMFSFAGAHMKNHFALINMIYDAISEREIVIRAQSVQITRSYLYAADMAVWLWRLLLDGKSGVIYQVGSSQPVSMMRLAQEIRKNFGPMMIEHEPHFSNDPRPYYVADPRLIMDELGVKQYTSFEDAIARTCKHYREDMVIRQ